MITRLEIENFKAIKKVAIDLTPLTVLVGPNDAGKSTVLQVLDLLARSVNRPLWQAGTPSVLDRPPEEVIFERDTNLLARICVSGSIPPVADHLPAEPSTYSYSISFGSRAGPTGPFRFFDESLVWNGKEQFTHSENSVNGPGLGMHHWDGSHTVLATFFRTSSGTSIAPVRRELDSFLVAFDASRLRAPSAATDLLTTSGEGLSGTIDQLLTAMDRTPLESYERALRRISPHVQGVATRPVQITRPGGSTPGKEVWFSLRGTKKGFSAQEASTGLVLVAGYLALLHGTPHGRFLVEEPENGVHPNAALAVVDVLREMVAAGRQVIATTHSPIILNYMDPEDVQIITRTAEQGVAVTPMMRSRFFDERSQKFDLGELWYSVGEDALVSTAS